MKRSFERFESPINQTKRHWPELLTPAADFLQPPSDESHINFSQGPNFQKEGNFSRICFIDLCFLFHEDTATSLRARKASKIVKESMSLSDSRDKRSSSKREPQTTLCYIDFKDPLKKNFLTFWYCALLPVCKSGVRNWNNLTMFSFELPNQQVKPIWLKEVDIIIPRCGLIDYAG